ncbi:hypothetical protein LTR70_007618 [Exophiala xenobiotica]|uniref:Metallo-beta-lactamase domain-containing protein n=1 Tax=Lithohypha guttulata TaxID=1690604 RepID=A0ABR0K3Q2_9EURO|nr:hypothetical protein LTR24_007150 [Lithohypha guttulata]KAK5313432.1 hypothetical protein LTR70_007618 [Exophiala xenobiotica]
MAAARPPHPDYISPSFEDTADFADADRGFIDSLKPCHIKDARGKTVWNNDEHSFAINSPCPATANPKLWRQAQLLSKQGLYCISPSIYQVRGFDISHITFVEGKTGIIVIDPLISYHYGGAAGVLPAAVLEAGLKDIPIIAPEGFVEEATSENIFAGPIMRFRATYMYGNRLPRSPVGQIGVGLGMGASKGTTSLIPPTVDIKHTGETLTIDNVRIVFQMVPDTEAPAEMNMYFPDERALLVAECAVHALHNIITLRGALVRDAKAWSKGLDETSELFCEEAGAEVLFASHSWPTWGNKRLTRYIEEERDLYAYLHDQTVRLMNTGLNGTEIAERLVLPPALRRAWHTQGFYGSVSHNIKGIYQRYMTWFDGSAENLWKWPPREEGCRYVKAIGGVDEVLKKAKSFTEQGDLRFAATLLGHVLAAGDEAGGTAVTRSQCKEILADVFERLGFGSENATWRNFYLGQSMDLKSGNRPRPTNVSAMATLPPGIQVEDWLGGLSISLDGEQAGKDEQQMCIDLQVKDTNESWRLILSNGVLTYRRQASKRPSKGDEEDLVLSLSKAELHQILTGKKGTGEVQTVRGDIKAFDRLLSFAGIGGTKSRGASHL